MQCSKGDCTTALYPHMLQVEVLWTKAQAFDEPAVWPAG